MLILLFVLLVVYQVKHLLADFFWQTEYMLGKFNEHNWVVPLSAHCVVHAGCTMLIFIVATMIAATSLQVSDFTLCVALGMFDFALHFCMDRIKASPHLCGRYNPTQYQFWRALGIDQMVHHLTHYVCIWVIIVRIY